MTGSDDTSARIVELARRLTARTRAGAITWRRMASPTRFLYVGTTGSVTVEAIGGTPVVGSALGARVLMCVLDPDAREVERVETRVSGPGQDTDDAALRDLYAAASTSGSSGSRVVDSLFRELG